MNKTIKRTGIVLGAALLLLLLAAVVIAGFFQDAVGRKLISELNKQVTTELKVTGFDLSLLRNFPDATVSLNGVSVMGANEEPLMEAGEMSFNFRLLSLFGSSVKVHAMAIRNGALTVQIDRFGKANYDILKGQATEKGASFSIILKEARLENMELSYRNEKLRQEAQTHIGEAKFSGGFSSEQYDLQSSAQLTSRYVDLGDVRYFAGKNWGYDAHIFVDVPGGTYDLQKVNLTVDGNTFNVQGSLKKEEDAQALDLVATATDANLESVIALLPQQYLEALGDFTSKGRFRLTTTVKGRLSASESPAIDMEFGLEDGRLESPRLKGPFKDVSFRATFTNRAENATGNTVFEISGFKGYLNRELMTLRLRVENLDDPYVDFMADGVLPVGYVTGLFGNPAISGGKGEVEFKDVKISGLYRDMVSMDNIAAVVVRGDLEFDDAALFINDEKLFIDRGQFHFDDNMASLQDFRLSGTGSEIELSGQVQNLLPVLLADASHSGETKLAFQAELVSPKMDLARLVGLTDIPMGKRTAETEVSDSLKVAKNSRLERIVGQLEGVFQARVDAFTYDKIEGRDFSGMLIFENREMRIFGEAKGMSGSFDLDGTLFFEKQPRLEAKLSCQDIDVKEFFRETKNVGQDFIRQEHLSGTMNAKMLLHTFWDSTGTFLPGQMHVWAGVGIEEGELKDFEMLEEFSDYANVKDLRQVRFVNLQNWLEVKNSTVYLPAMFLQNNAMNLTASGEQTFDGRIDYNIKVNAGQVLANKFKKHNAKLQPISAKKDGFFNMYFNIKGTLDDYHYGTNKKLVKEKFAQSERQKRQIRGALIRAFGAPLNMLREPPGWQDAGEPAAEDDDVEYIEGF
jgi:AsmA-like C-terminal region